MAPKPSVDEVLNTFGDVDLSVTSADGPRCFRVSSHQLKASSPFFEGRLKAIKVMEAPFHLNISLEDMPLQAVRIVLEILHGQPHGYASSLTAGDIELLYQIARVTDHFKCEERMTDWGTIWLNHPLSELMKNSIHLDKLIFISEVFQHQEGFEAATRLAILRSYTRLNSKEVFWDFRTESYSQENVMRGTFTATRSLVLSE